VRGGHEPSSLNFLDDSPVPTTEAIVDICARLENRGPRGSRTTPVGCLRRVPLTLPIKLTVHIDSRAAKPVCRIGQECMRVRES
jgi:hypothetical protein